MPTKKTDLIFITGRQRSGTTVFRLLLENHGAYNADEIFHGVLSRKDRFYEYLYQRVLEDKNLIFPAHHQRIFNDYIGFLRLQSAGRPIAMDVKYNNYNLLTPPHKLMKSESFIIDYMQASKAPVIHIERKNKLRIYISQLIAQKTGIWGIGKKENIPSGRLGITVDLKNMQQELKNITHATEIARKKLSKLEHVYEISYETMFDSEGNFSTDIMQIVRDVLAIQQVNPKPAHVKINSEPLTEIIANYAAVARVLAGTDYEWMLENR